MRAGCGLLVSISGPGPSSPTAASTAENPEEKAAESPEPATLPPSLLGKLASTLRHCTRLAIAAVGKNYYRFTAYARRRRTWAPRPASAVARCQSAAIPTPAPHRAA